VLEYLAGLTDQVRRGAHAAHADAIVIGEAETIWGEILDGCGCPSPQASMSHITSWAIQYPQGRAFHQFARERERARQTKETGA